MLSVVDSKMALNKINKIFIRFLRCTKSNLTISMELIEFLNSELIDFYLAYMWVLVVRFEVSFFTYKGIVKEIFIFDRFFLFK